LVVQTLLLGSRPYCNLFPSLPRRGHKDVGLLIPNGANGNGDSSEHPNDGSLHWPPSHGSAIPWPKPKHDRIEKRGEITYNTTL